MSWYRVVNREGQKIDNQKSPMGKVDYHTLGACWDVLDRIEVEEAKAGDIVALAGLDGVEIGKTVTVKITSRTGEPE